VLSLLDRADLTLAGEEHDFVLPYGFYRKIPNSMASTFRSLDTVVRRSPVGDNLASVSYWNTSVE
jgi:hypothetical protein